MSTETENCSLCVLNIVCCVISFKQLQWLLAPEGGAIPQDVPGSELALTVVPPGANGSLIAEVSF